MRVRELRLVDIGIPLDENFYDNINFLKGGSMPILRRFIEAIPFKKQIFKTANLKPFDYSKIWEHDNKNPMLYAGLTPLAIDDKYNNGKNDFTPEEEEKCKRLLTFDTPNYKPKKIGVFDK